MEKAAGLGLITPKAIGSGRISHRCTQIGTDDFNLCFICENLWLKPRELRRNNTSIEPFLASRIPQGINAGGG
jgi:hypothetical protein